MIAFRTRLLDLLDWESFPFEMGQRVPLSVYADVWYYLKYIYGDYRGLFTRYPGGILRDRCLGTDSQILGSYGSTYCPRNVCVIRLGRSPLMSEIVTVRRWLGQGFKYGGTHVKLVNIHHKIVTLKRQRYVDIWSTLIHRKLAI